MGGGGFGDGSDAGLEREVLDGEGGWVVDVEVCVWGRHCCGVFGGFALGV